MKAIVRRLSLLRVILVLLLISVPAWGQAANVYLANTAMGGKTGADCADAHAYTFFNSSANWGTGSTQIGPGTTVHLCGTITGTPGSSGLIPQGSGTSGNPITIHFESGAILQNTYWSSSGKGDEWSDSSAAGIFFSSVNYFVVDGGGTPSNADCNTTNATTTALAQYGICGLPTPNGIIQDTANGSALANQIEDVGIAIYGSSSNIEIKNLEITNIYIHQNGPDSCNSQGTGSGSCLQWNGRYSTDIDLDTTGSNILIHNNALTIAGKAVSDGDGAISVYNNYMGNHAWMMFVGGGNTVTVYNNEWTDWTNWSHPINNYHQNGVHSFSGGGSSMYFYNNYVHGNMCPSNPYGGCSVSAMFYNESDNDMYVFNNLMEIDSGAQSQPIAYCGTSCTGAYPNYLYNNTIIGAQPSDGVATWYEGSPPVYSENNIATAQSTGFDVYTNGGANPDCAVTNYNDFYGFSGNGCTEGANSTTANPNLTSAYLLQSTSPGKGTGANLTSSCSGALVALCSDKAGNARPTGSTAWDMGAYQYSTSAAPAPPTGLTAVVQ